MATNKVFIFSLLAIFMVESRTLTDILEKNKPTIAEASSSLKADSVMVNHSKLNGALPRNLRPDALLIKDTKPTSSSKPIRTTDATPTSVANSMMMTSLEPVTNYSQSSVLEEDTKSGEELAEYIKSTQVINQHEGTATTETELTPPVSVSTSTMISSQAESMNYTQSSVIEEFPETNTVPRAIGSHVFFGKSEMYNMTTDEYYNQIYPTHNCDVFLIGKLLKVADTPHNRMVFAKFAEEDTDSCKIP
ncbi:hypothetical protein POM88_034593 [Heracleum sosnowskyi]|uniref:Uncharacterized protein n=1 Tax=Heracleum sosnowskyi TaxID=360622 RepID=A0AAD8HKU9_9APIA|nr:hypothetical protein POM88_034593 [Heracleum sosnowskyi]